MKRLLSSRACIAAVIAVCVAIAVPHVAGADTIKIGAILALSGNSAVLGQSVRDGLQLAVDEINKRGGVNGSRIELFVEDSKTDPQSGIEAFNRIEMAHHPLFYVSHLSSVTVALAPIAEETHVVLEAVVTSVGELTRGREWIFRYWPLGQAFIPPLMRILQDVKTKKLGILYQNDELNREQQQLMAKAFTDAGGTVTSEMVEMKDTDFRAKIASLKSQEAVYVACTGNILNGVLRQFKEADYRGKILTHVSAVQPALFGLPEADGIYMTATIIHNADFLYAKEAEKKFTARYHRAFDQWEASGYDLVKLIMGLLEDRQVSRQSVRDLLAGGFEYSGVFGHLSSKPGQHDLSIPLYPAQVVNGALEYR